MSGVYVTSQEMSFSTIVQKNDTDGTYHPWQNIPLPEKVFEIIYLSLLTVIGSIGNLIIIFSIALEDRIHSHGNAFVINLAIADLIVTGFVMPTMLANVIAGSNALGMGACKVVGFMVTVTCTCSVANLTAIAINRYCAVVHTNSYLDMFTKKNVLIVAIICWVWSCIISLPTLVGWSRVGYDEKIQVCAWDEAYSYSYTVFLIILAIIAPLTIVFFCYTKLFLTVRKRGKWVRSLSLSRNSQISVNQNKRSLKKERNLLQTLATSVALFSVCWLPYGMTMLIDPVGVPALPKKIFGWIGLSNSAVNFVIYGAMNRVFRRGYQNLFYFLLKCKNERKATSTVLHGSNSESAFRATIRKKACAAPPARNSVGKPHDMNESQNSTPHFQHSMNSNEVISTPQTTRATVIGRFESMEKVAQDDKDRISEDINPNEQTERQPQPSTESVHPLGKSVEKN